MQTDGQLKTGRDVVIATLLGAEEFGFATAPLVVMGCVMMRVCHLDTCPVGVATQNPQLREKFSGKAEHVVNFFMFIAQEVRELLAQLGFRSIEEAVGHSEVLNVDDAVRHWKTEGLDLSAILYRPEIAPGASLHRTTSQDHGIDKALDNELIKICAPAIENGEPVRAQLTVRNVNRTVGTMLGSSVTRKWGGQGLPEGTIDLLFTGSAGQSFGAFLPKGVTLRLEGDANDYVGKGISGGKIIVKPSGSASFDPAKNVIAGNVIGYGATSGEIYLRGIAGERFCVRNSGATAVVEGVGDHGCEYMTGGRVLILGPTGRNFAAGMSGGIAYLLDVNPAKLNREMVNLEKLDQEDIDFLHQTLTNHHNETGSTVAQELLQDWPLHVHRLSKVMPIDYRRVLDAQAKAVIEGKDPLVAIMQASVGK